MSELKPCVCGHSDAEISFALSKLAYVKCFRCGHQTDFYIYRVGNEKKEAAANAVKEWNNEYE